MTKESVVQKYIPMTETMFYILLSLREEQHGYAIRHFVQQLTNNRLDIGAGTMYQSLGKLHKDGLIKMTREVDRQKRYIITSVGLEILKIEAQRIRELYGNVEALL